MKIGTKQLEIPLGWQLGTEISSLFAVKQRSKYCEKISKFFGKSTFRVINLIITMKNVQRIFINLNL